MRDTYEFQAGCALYSFASSFPQLSPCASVARERVARGATMPGCRLPPLRATVPTLLACCVGCVLFQSRLAMVHEEVSRMHEEGLFSRRVRPCTRAGNLRGHLPRLASLGYFVCIPNFTGSTGFGIPLMDAVLGDGCGVADLADCVACARFLKTLVRVRV